MKTEVYNICIGLCLALTALVALHISPNATPATTPPATDTIHADASPLGLLPWAMRLAENKAYTWLKNTPAVIFQRPIPVIIDEPENEKDSLGIDLGRLDMKIKNPEFHKARNPESM